MHKQSFEGLNKALKNFQKLLQKSRCTWFRPSVCSEEPFCYFRKHHLPYTRSPPIDLSIKTLWNAEHLTSHLGYLRRSAGANFHWYIWECNMLSDSCHFAYKGNPQLPRHRSRVPASAFSTVLVRTPCNFLGHESEPSATTRCRRITIGGEL